MSWRHVYVGLVFLVSCFLFYLRFTRSPKLTGPLSVNNIVQFIGVNKESDNCVAGRQQFHKLGDHIIAEFMECQNQINLWVDDIMVLEQVLEKAALAAGATLLGFKSHKFVPQGMTGVAVLKESHISVHTWPEYNYVAVDAFTCGEHISIEKAFAVLEQFFAPQKISSVKLDRGLLRE